VTAPRDNGTNPRIDLAALARDRVGEAGEDLGFWRRLRLWSERLSALKGILAAVVFILAGVGAAAMYMQGAARRADLAPLGERADAQELRIALLERDLDWIKRTLYQLAERSGARPAAPP